MSLLVGPLAVRADQAAPGVHVVLAGETLSQIADDAGVDAAALAALNGIDDPNVLIAGQPLKVPAHASSAASAAGSSATAAGSSATAAGSSATAAGSSATASGPSATAPGKKTYTVADGDTLWAIAQRFGSSPDALAQLNNLDDPGRLTIGVVLSVPGGASVASAATPAANSQAPAPTAAAGTSATATTASAGTPPAAAGASRRTVVVSYTVQSGETLSKIAHQFDTAADAIAQASGLDDPNKLSIGAVLKVPLPAKEHLVVAGETLRDIAASEKVDLGALIDFNQLDDPGLIRVGQVVLLPVAANQHVAASPGPSATDAKPSTANATTANTAAGAATSDAATAADADTPSANSATSTGTTAAATSPAGAPAVAAGTGTAQSASNTPNASSAGAPSGAAAATPSSSADVAQSAATAKPANQSAPTATTAAKPTASSTSAPAPKPAVVLAPPRGAPSDGLAGSGLKLLGAPYVWGGSSPSGFDCSGFIWYVAKQIGKPLGRGLFGQYNSGSHPGRDELKIGDLVFFQNTYSPGLSHNGIYIGSGQFVHAADEAAGVTISSLGTAYWSAHWFGATRLP